MCEVLGTGDGLAQKAQFGGFEAPVRNRRLARRSARGSELKSPLYAPVPINSAILPIVRQLRPVARTPSAFSARAASFDRPMPWGACK